MSQNNKIVKFRKTSHINIGVVIFVIIFLYMAYNIFHYFTIKHVAAYEVSQGTIAQNNTFTGVIIRDELVYNAEISGYINYFNKDATKVGVHTYVYTVDETGDFYKEVTKTNEGLLFSDESAYEDLEKTASNYVLNYSDQNFYQVYTFKYDMEAALMEALSENALSSLGEYAGNSAAFHSYLAPQPGIVVYNVDGLEAVTLDNFNADAFDESAHVKTNLMARKKVNAGEPAYKLLTSEQWDLVVPIEEALAAELAEEQNIQIEFQKDNSTAWATSSIQQRDGGFYLILHFQNSAIRFATDRYLDIKLLLSDTNGLKIPNTALTQKEFFVIPKEYLTKGGDSDENGILRQSTDKDGNILTDGNGNIIPEFIAASVFHETDTSYYITGSQLKKGDVLIKPDSMEQFVLNETASLEGVYNINKGYAVFRKVEKLFQNEEYTIIASGTSSGVSLYDHIALDASAVRENQIIK